MDNVKKLFIQALIEAKDNELSKLKSEDEIEWEFSEKFENSMNKLIKKNNHIQLSTRRTVRRGLLAAIIALIIAFIGLMSVTATRTPFIEFIKKVFPQYNEITLSEESTPPVDKIETEYTLTALPEGFEVKEYQKDDLGILTVWENSNGNRIILMQDLLDSNFSFDNEHEYEELYINGYEAYYYSSQLTWTDGIYWFTLGITNGEKSEILELAKNIVEKN